MTITVADLREQLFEASLGGKNNWIITTSTIKENGEIKEIRLYATPTIVGEEKEILLYIFTPMTDWYPVTEE